jgi:hypothetical protein
MTIDAAENYVLTEAVDDWVYARYFYGPYVSLPLSDRHRAALGLAQSILARDLLTAGDVTEDGFVAWPHPIEEILYRLARDWPLGSADEPGLGELAWFNITPHGSAVVV